MTSPKYSIGECVVARWPHPVGSTSTRIQSCYWHRGPENELNIREECWDYIVDPPSAFASKPDKKRMAPGGWIAREAQLSLCPTT